MPGIKGMTAAEPRPNVMRKNIWRSMRIMRRFTIADLCRTSGAVRSNVRKFIKRLEAHGYVVQHGSFVAGRTGVYRPLRLVKDTGPVYPMRCDTCGRPLGQPCQTNEMEHPHENNDLD